MRFIAITKAQNGPRTWLDYGNLFSLDWTAGHVVNLLHILNSGSRYVILQRIAEKMQKRCALEKVTKECLPC